MASPCEWLEVRWVKARDLCAWMSSGACLRLAMTLPLLLPHQHALATSIWAHNCGETFKGIANDDALRVAFET